LIHVHSYLNIVHTRTFELCNELHSNGNDLLHISLLFITAYYVLTGNFQL